MGNPIGSLLTDHYYQPTAGDHHFPYDSFVYNPDSHQISAFQVVIERECSLASQGVRALRALGRRLQINDLKIRIIVVVLGDGQVTFRVDGDLYDTGIEVYALRVTENQLYHIS